MVWGCGFLCGFSCENQAVNFHVDFAMDSAAVETYCEFCCGNPFWILGWKHDFQPCPFCATESLVETWLWIFFKRKRFIKNPRRKFTSVFTPCPCQARQTVLGGCDWAFPSEQLSGQSPQGIAGGPHWQVVWQAARHTCPPEARWNLRLNHASSLATSTFL